MQAELLLRERIELPSDAWVEMVIWRVPEPIKGSSHLYKYRLFYGRDGKRIVGYDNERPKGDHRHIDGREEQVQFDTLDALLEEFLAEVRTREGV